MLIEPSTLAIFMAAALNGGSVSCASLSLARPAVDQGLIFLGLAFRSALSEGVPARR